jgi:hypothetical protein
LHSKYLTKEALEGSGDFKIGRQVICALKYAHDLVLLAKEETVLQDMIDRLIEIRRCYRMEMNMEKLMERESQRAAIPGTHYGRSKAARDYGIFQLFG